MGIMDVPLHQLRERMVVSSIPAPSCKALSPVKQRWKLLRGCLKTSPRKRREKKELLESARDPKLLIKGHWMQLAGSETDVLGVSIVRAITANAGRELCKVCWYPLARYCASYRKNRSSRGTKYMSIQWSDYYSQEPFCEEELYGSHVDASVLTKIKKTVISVKSSMTGKWRKLYELVSYYSMNVLEMACCT